MELIKIPTLSFKKIDNPYEDEIGKDYMFIANIKDLPSELDGWRKINVRDAKLSSNVSKGIEDTLINAPDHFFFRNRGITLIAENIKLDQKKSCAEITLADREYHGLLDGGHTYSVIKKYLSETAEPSDAYVRVEVIIGLQDNQEIVSVVEARNKSTQVQEQGIQELLKKFEPIKKVLKEEQYEKNIAYKEFELSDEGNRKTIDIKDILSYLLCFYTDEFNRDNHPIKAYTQKTGIVRQYASDMDNDKGKKSFNKYFHLLPSILRLHDEIIKEFKETYNKVGRRFAYLEGVKERKKNQQPIILSFTGIPVDYRLPSAYVYPILAAFRANVVCEKGKCNFKKEPIALFHELKEGLVSRLAEQAKKYNNPDKTGKDTAVWGRCYDLVLMELMQQGL